MTSVADEVVFWVDLGKMGSEVLESEAEAGVEEAVVGVEVTMLVCLVESGGEGRECQMDLEVEEDRMGEVGAAAIEKSAVPFHNSWLSIQNETAKFISCLNEAYYLTAWKVLQIPCS